ncbi:hydroxypyruvate isomerase family protein [Patulibacter sp. S7RM1-6]
MASCTFLFTERPVLERPAAAAAAGFDAIELWWPFPTPTPPAAEVDALVAAVRDAGVALTGLTLYGGDAGAGERGLLSLPGREDEFRAAVDAAVALAGRLGVRGLTCLYGNRLPDHDPAEQDAVADRNLPYAAEAAASVGAVLLLEPVSGAPHYPLRTADDVVAVLDRHEAAGAGPPVRMLADLYHLATNGDDVAAVIARHASRIGHVQVADAPGRHEPGTGDLDLDGLVTALAAAGYAGRVAFEYVPSGSTEASLRSCLPGAAAGTAAGPAGADA